MITPSEEDYIRRHAHIPEHLIWYVVAIAQVEPLLIGDYLCYKDKDAIIFIGYPLSESFNKKRMKELLDAAAKQYKPEQIALIAPEIPLSREICTASETDHYYRSDLSRFCLTQKVRHMIHRASRELYVTKGREMSDAHRVLISEFLNSHTIDDATRYIIERVPQYVHSTLSTLVVSARDKSEKLVAFSVADFGAHNYAFYMFHFMSRQNYVPGASDVLLNELIDKAKEQGKSFVNLGLGINKGITFFKKKFGGMAFLRYEYCLFSPKGKKRLTSLIQRLYGPIESYAAKIDKKAQK